MPKKRQLTVILCVDRDNDLGRKAGVEGPIIGREKNLEAANKLLLADPTESDANCIFAAVKMYDELKDKIDGLEVITITGFGKAGFKSDQRLNEQLDELEKKYSINGFILVTDGAEDDQVVPILQSRAKIISKEVVVIKQAQPVESIYYTIKEALEDPYIARIVFAIPGTIVLFYALTLFLNIQSLFIQGVSFIVGLYLVMKGLGIELKLSRMYKSTLDALSPQKASFPFYVGSIFIFIFGVYAFLQNIFFGSAELTMEHYISALQSTYLFFALVFISVCFARALDHVQMKKAYLLRKDFLYAVSVITIWIIIDSATLVFLREADLNFFLFSMLVSFVIILIAFKVSDGIDLTKRATELLLGLPVYDIAGKWLGRIVEVDKRRNAIVFAKSGNEQQRSQKFRLVDGKVLVI
jgi:putative membrane protein